MSCNVAQCGKCVERVVLHFFFNTSASTTNNNESKNEGKIEIARACKRDAIAIVDNNKHNE